MTTSSPEETPRQDPPAQRLQRRNSSSSSVCNWEDEALKAPNIYQFERDLYTNAFLSVLSLSGSDSKLKHGPALHFCGSFFTPCICLGFVVFIQVFALAGVADFVSTSWDLSLGGYDYALRDYTYTNHTMQVGISQPLCGEFEQFEFENQITMRDGSMYMASDDHPIAYAYKMPGGSWDSENIVDDKSLLDESLLAVGDDFHTNAPELIENQDVLRNMLAKGGLRYWSSGSVYWVYHYSMSMLLAFVLIVEVRKIFRFAVMILHFYWTGQIAKRGEPCFAHDKSSGQLELCALSRSGFAAGLFVVVVRSYVVICLCIASFWLFLLSMSRMDLIFNALALSFILEIDDLVYLALTSHFTRKMVDDIKGIELPDKARKVFLSVPLHNILTPLVFFFVACLFSVSCRLGQLYMRKCYFAAIASACLFLGPTPEVTSYPIVAPVPGFCESLLHAACAANVTGPASANGPCYIADAQDVPKQLRSMNEPFENMFDASGTRRSWIEWGAPKPDLLAAGWDALAHSQRNVLRKICLQMYQPDAAVDTRVVDDDTEEVMNGAPFFCPADILYPIIVPHPGNATNIFDITKDYIVRAIDRCRLSPDHPAISEYLPQTKRTGKGGSVQHTKKKTSKRTGKGGIVHQTKHVSASGRPGNVEMLNHPPKWRSHHHTLSTGSAVFLDRLWSH